MIIELIDTVGGRPLRVAATQFLVRSDNGTPIAVGGHFGPDGGYRIAHAADADFNRVLTAFGYGQHTIEAQDVRLSAPPAGAKLLTP